MEGYCFYFDATGLMKVIPACVYTDGNKQRCRDRMAYEVRSTLVDVEISRFSCIILEFHYFLRDGAMPFLIQKRCALSFRP